VVIIKKRPNEVATWYASELTIQIKADLSRDGQSLILTKAGFNLPCLS